MKKGMILEKNKRYFTILTPDGNFVQLDNKKQEYSVGQEVFYVEKDVAKKKRVTPYLLQSRTISVLALAVAILIVVMIPLSNDIEIYAYVSLDINPSLELGINDDLEVIDIIPYNDSAKDVRDSLQNWKGENFQVVIDHILNAFEEQGYFKNKNEILIGTVFIDENNEQIKQEVNTMIGDIEESLLTKKVNVECLTATKNDRDLAVDQGTTTGRFIDQKNQSTKEKSPVQQETKKSAIEENPVIKKPAMIPTPQSETKRIQMDQDNRMDNLKVEQIDTNKSNHSSENMKQYKQKNKQEKDNKQENSNSVKKNQNNHSNKNGNRNKNKDNKEHVSKDNNRNKNDKSNKGNGNQREQTSKENKSNQRENQNKGKKESHKEKPNRENDSKNDNQSHHVNHGKNKDLLDNEKDRKNGQDPGNNNGKGHEKN